MGIYSKTILPRGIDFTCGLKPDMRQREKVVPLASGEVLGIGVGRALWIRSKSEGSATVNGSGIGLTALRGGG